MKSILKIISGIVAASITLTCFTAFGAESYVSNGGFEYQTYEFGLSISAPLYFIDYNTENQREAESIEPMQKITVAADAVNDSENEISATVVTGVYDSAGVMKGIECCIKKLQPKSKEKYEYEISIPGDIGYNGSLRSFVIGSFADSLQYTESIGYPNNGLTQAGWNISANASLTAAEKYLGLGSLKFKNTGGSESTEQNVILEPNSAFKINLYTKGAGGYSCGMTDADGEIVVDSQKIEGCEEWENRSILFKTKSDGNVNLKFIDTASDGESYIDNVYITDNMVSNSSFSNGASLWNIDSSLGSIDETTGYDDSNSLRITSNSNAVAASQSIEVFPNSLYLVSFKTKGNAKLKTTVTTDDGKCIGGIAETAQSQEWVENYAFLNTFGYSNINLNISALDSSGDTSYIDDLSIGKLIYPDVVRNGDFEDDNITEWLPETINGVELRRLYDEENANSGRGALMLTDKAVAHHAVRQFVTDQINEQGSGKYVLSGCMKYASGATPVIRMIINGSNTPLANKVCDFDNGYSYFELTFDITAPVKDAYVRCYAANTMDDFWLDDVHIVKLP